MRLPKLLNPIRQILPRSFEGRPRLCMSYPVLKYLHFQRSWWHFIGGPSSPATVDPQPFRSKTWRFSGQVGPMNPGSQLFLLENSLHGFVMLDVGNGLGATHIYPKCFTNKSGTWLRPEQHKSWPCGDSSHLSIIRLVEGTPKTIGGGYGGFTCVLHSILKHTMLQSKVYKFSMLCIFKIL